MSDGRFKPGNKKGIREGSPYRRPDGTMLPGHTANPGGPPKGLVARIREAHGEDAIRVFAVAVRVALGETPDGYGEVKASDRTKCIELVLNRILGKPQEHVEITGGITPQQQAVLEALRMTPHERRLAAQDTSAPPDEGDDAAALDSLTGDRD